MHAIDPQLMASQVLRVFEHEAVYLFLGAAFISVGAVSAAFSVLRRKVDPVLLWLAGFAILYGTRLWSQTDLLTLIVPDTLLFRDLRSVIDYSVPIPAFFFFKASGFLGRRGSIWVYVLTSLYVGLIVLSLIVGQLPVFDEIDNITIIAAMIALVARSMRRSAVSRDFVIIRIGLLFFAVCSIGDGIAEELGRYPQMEPYGFVVFLGSLGFVAARQTLEREAKLREIRKELEIARRIQFSILPAEFPESKTFKVAARYVPMTAVAGDFYEYLVGDDRHAGLLIADVSGHGVPAALIASMVKMAASSQRDKASDPAMLLEGMNAALCGNAQEQYVTAAYVYLDSESETLRYSAAAHPAMMLLRDGGVTEIRENGTMMAIFPTVSYTTTSCPLMAGDRLLLYTDGISEAFNMQGEEFGKKRLQALLRDSATLTGKEVADLIVASVHKWAEIQEDDLTVLVCDYRRV